ncbi:hypothetical protein ACGFZK_18920 [Streptomyces sp. NPDC048257]|uniref:hypothetical protein n=1 Tax=Streptomyces sp. NPDC048257 TaxID=3365526 RepID=UPI003723C6BC
MCSWYEYAPTQKRIALVRWDVKRGGDATANARVQQTGFAADAAEGRRANNLGFGDGAYWESGHAEWSCVLSVRHGNLVVWVGLSPPQGCEGKAKEVAKAALAAVHVSQ